MCFECNRKAFVNFQVRLVVKAFTGKKHNVFHAKYLEDFANFVCWTPGRQKENTVCINTIDFTSDRSAFRCVRSVTVKTIFEEECPEISIQSFFQKSSSFRRSSKGNLWRHDFCGSSLTTFENQSDRFCLHRLAKKIGSYFWRVWRTGTPDRSAVDRRKDVPTTAIEGSRRRLYTRVPLRCFRHAHDSAMALLCLFISAPG